MNIEIGEKDLRPCYVGANHKKALFHRWVDYSSVVDASPMIGGHPGGIVRHTLGIVEYENGSVERVLPHNIKFADDKFSDFRWEEFDEDWNKVKKEK